MSRILIITGPAGAGKSTACEAFAKDSEGTWALISQDHIRTFIKAGFKNPSDKPWTDDTQKQWDVSQAICGDILRRYKDMEINCIMECFAPKGSFDKWERHLEKLDYKLIVLLPHVNEAIHRNGQRTGAALLKEAEVQEQHEWFSAWVDDSKVTLIDNTKMSVADTVNAIKQTIS